MLQFYLHALFQSAQHLYEKRDGSGSRAGSGAGSVLLTNGYGSGRPKNMRILWIRIPNTASLHIERPRKYQYMTQCVCRLMVKLVGWRTC